MSKNGIVKYQYQPLVPIQTLSAMSGLMQFGREKFMAAMPEGSGCTVDGIIQSALLAANKNQKILLCTEESIYQSVLTTCRLGLDCSGVLGIAYLVPYKRECTLIIGYRGLTDLARRAADAVRIDSQVVYGGDEIDVKLGTDAHVHHKPDLQNARKAEDIIGCYAVAHLRGSDVPMVEWMSRDEVNRIRARSPSCDQGPWVTDTGEMIRKTPLRRIIKRLPISVVEAGKVLAEAIEHDNSTTGLADRGAEVSAADRTAEIADRFNGENNATNSE